jgi:hypothetical protein
VLHGNPVELGSGEEERKEVDKIKTYGVKKSSRSVAAGSPPACLEPC